MMKLPLLPSKTPTLACRGIALHNEGIQSLPRILPRQSRALVQRLIVIGMAMFIPILTRTASKTSQGLPGALSDGERWYAVHTLPFAEPRAQGQLHDLRILRRAGRGAGDRALESNRECGAEQRRL